MKPELLHVVTAISNPIRWESRIRLYREFEERMLDAGVHLTVVECEYGERPFQLNLNPHVTHIGVRSKTVVWNKECLLNIGTHNLSRHFPDWKYICYNDADITFRKDCWASDAVHALQQYDVIQPWSDAYDLGPNDEHIQAHKSFCRVFWEDKPICPTHKNFWKFDGGPYDYPHSGYSWCWTRNAIEWIGRLIEFAAMGAGDHHMALSLVGKADRSIPGNVSEAYRKHLFNWQRKALHHINYNIGFLWGTIEHSWHGRKTERKYVDRWKMIVDNHFDPDIDLKKNSFGVVELAGNKPKLTHEFDKYFRQRNEDANCF